MSEKKNEVGRIGVGGGLVLGATFSAVPALFIGAGFAKISNATSAYAPIGVLNIVAAGIFVALVAVLYLMIRIREEIASR